MTIARATTALISLGSKRYHSTIHRVFVGIKADSGTSSGLSAIMLDGGKVRNAKTMLSGEITFFGGGLHGEFYYLYTYLGDNWFEARISKQTTVRIRVESEPDDDESFVITGLVNKNYGINVK